MAHMLNVAIPVTLVFILLNCTGCSWKSLNRSESHEIFVMDASTIKSKWVVAHSWDAGWGWYSTVRGPTYVTIVDDPDVDTKALLSMAKSDRSRDIGYWYRLIERLNARVGRDGQSAGYDRGTRRWIISFDPVVILSTTRPASEPRPVRQVAPLVDSADRDVRIERLDVYAAKDVLNWLRGEKPTPNNLALLASRKHSATIGELLDDPRQLTAIIDEASLQSNLE